MALMVKMARAGAGLTIGMAETFAPLLHTRELRALLKPYCHPLPGFLLLYPSRRHLPLKLRALVNRTQKWRHSLVIMTRAIFGRSESRGSPGGGFSDSGSLLAKEAGMDGSSLIA